jgi:hypothetical protein
VKRGVKIGKNEVIFTIAAVGFAGMTVAAILFEREPSALLLGAILAVLGYPIFLETERRP